MFDFASATLSAVTALPGAPALIEPLEPRTFLAAHPIAISVTNLVSDGAIAAAHTDPNLVNSWGIVVNPATRNLLVADNGTGLVTQYVPDGTPAGSPITIPGPGNTGSGAPTGVVVNTVRRDFVFSSGGNSGPAQFLVATEDGTVAAINANLNATTATIVVDNSASGAIYKGLTTAKVGRHSELFLADFHNNRIDVVDRSFNSVTAPTGAFQDSSIPAGFAPFNIQRIGNRLFVTYAKQDADAHDDVPGAGNGFIDVYSARGKLLKRFASGGNLDSPWAIVQAPGRFGGNILVGNFGDGTVTTFRSSGKPIGQLQDASANPVTLNGLWGMTLGSTKATRQTLFFASGPNGEADGLVGALTAAKVTISV